MNVVGEDVSTRSIILNPDLSELARARHLVSEVATEAGFPDSRVFDISVVSSEATANAIEHARVKDSVEVKTLLHPDRLEVQVTGPGEFQAPNRLNDGSSRGLGLPLMAKLSDHLALFSGPKGKTFVSLTFYLPGHQPEDLDAVPPTFRNLSEEDRLLDHVLKHLPDGFFVFDSDWRLIYLNSTMLARLGRLPSDLLGTTIWDAFPAFGPAARTALEAVKDRGGSTRVTVRGSTGSWLELSAFPVAEGIAVFSRDITEQKQAEEALRESEGRYRGLFDSLTEALAVLDLIFDEAGRVVDYVLVDVNPALAEMVGRPRADLVGHRVMEILPQHKQETLDRFGEVARTGKPAFFEVHSEDVDIWAEVLAYRTAQGQVVSLSHDTTAAKRAEAEKLKACQDLAEADSRFAALARNAPVGIALYSGDGTLMVHNQQAEKLLGLGRMNEEAVQDAGSAWRLVREDGSELPPEEHPVARVLSRSEAVTGLVVGVHRPGPLGPIWVSMLASARMSPDGEVSEVILYAQDITSRKLAEEALRDSKYQIELALQAAGAGMWVRDPDGSWVATRELNALFGRPPDAPLMKEEDFPSLVHPEDLPRLTEAWSRAIREGADYEQDYRVVWPDGSLHWLASRGRVKVEGDFPRFVGATYDITEQKQTEEALRESEERQAFLLKLSDALRPVSDPVEVQAIAARLLGEHLGANQVHYGATEGEVIHVYQGYGSGLPPMIGNFRYQDYGRRLIKTLRAGRTAVSHNVEKDPTITKAETARFSASGFRAYVAVPLVKEGEWVAALAAHSIEPREWTPNEVRLIEEVAERTWAAVERAQAEKALWKSEEEYRALFDHAEIGFVLVEPLFDDAGRVSDLRYLQINPAFERMTGLKADDFQDKRLMEALPGIEPGWLAPFDEAAKSHKPVRYEDYNRDTDRWYQIVVFPYPNGLLGEQFIEITERKQAEEALRQASIDTEADLEAMTALQRLATLSLRESSLDVVLLHIVDAAIAVTDADFGNMQLVNDKSGDLEIVAQRGFPDWWLDYWNRVGKGQGCCGTALASKERVVVEDVEQSPIFVGTPGLRVQLEAGVHAVQSTPLISRNGEPFGMVSTHYRAPHRLDPRRLPLLDLLASQAADIIEQTRSQRLLHENEVRYRALAEECEGLYRQQLAIAETLQLALLNVPSAIGSVRVGHLYRSATEAARVGGDFYDVFPIKDGGIAVLIGDVSGRGIEAARTATLVKDIVHAFTHQSIQTHEVLGRTNLLLIEKDLPGFVTLFLGILDAETGILRYSSAGHPDMMLRRASGEIVMLGSGTSPLGVFPEAHWKAHEVELEVNDLLLLYTDGIVEARRDGEMFGEKRLERLLRRKRVSPEGLPHLILEKVLAFSGGGLHDDVAVLTLLLTDKGDGGRPVR